MEGKVALIPSVTNFLINLVDVLYEEEYFGFEESAHDYVEEIKSSILNDLPTKIHYKTPPELSHHGKFYIKIKSNNRTLWYVFFELRQGRFLVQFITNNHAAESGFLNLL